jgi:polyribonucleotide nucleotidyltransferase
MANNSHNDQHTGFDSSKVTINIESNMAPRIIGRGGSTIRGIREKSGAKINVGELRE